MRRSVRYRTKFPCVRGGRYVGYRTDRIPHPLHPQRSKPDVAAPLSQFGRPSVARVETTMTSSSTAGPNWSTASLSAHPGTSPMELSALGDHLALCKSLGGRLLSLQCGAQAMHAFSTSRFMTTIVVMSTVVLACSMASA